MLLFTVVSLLQILNLCLGQCPFLRSLRDNPPTARIENTANTEFLDLPPRDSCTVGYCLPPSGNKTGNFFFTGPAGFESNSSEICVDNLPEGFIAVNQSQAQYSCLQLAANRSCELPDFQSGKYCSRTCGICNQPVYVDGFDGTYSGPNQLLTNGLYNSTRFLKTIPRVKCEAYNVTTVVEAIKSWAATGPPNLDLAKLVRAGFHDAADYNKWVGTGGPQGNLVLGQEAFYGQSHNLPMIIKSSLSQFKQQFGSALSWADLLQISAMTAVEISGGPKFCEFGFTPGRRDELGSLVSLDGLLPNAGPLANLNTNRDFWFRAGFDDFEIVASMGGHTLGGSFTGDFTSTPTEFKNEYYSNLLLYEKTTCCAPTLNGGLVQLSTDRALLTDPKTRAQVELYARNQSKFFEDYVKTVRKMSLFGQDVSVAWCDYD